MSSTPKLKSWHFVVKFDEDKIKQYGTTIDEVRAAINEIAQTHGMEEVEPGVWQPQDGSEDWLAQTVTLADMSEHKDIMRTVEHIGYWEGTEREYDYIESIRKTRPKLLVF